jgi:endonuclease I
LPGKQSDVQNLEWLQTSHNLDNTIVTIDSNRSNLTFFDVKEEKRMHVEFDPNWAVQDFVFVPAQARELIDVAKNYFKNHKDVMH